jgi:hypothetical protein
MRQLVEHLEPARTHCTESLERHGAFRHGLAEMNSGSDGDPQRAVFPPGEDPAGLPPRDGIRQGSKLRIRSLLLRSAHLMIRSAIAEKLDAHVKVGADTAAIDNFDAGAIGQGDHMALSRRQIRAAA